jgi:hypothetical protein
MKGACGLISLIRRSGMFKRLPPLQEIVPVYAVIASMLFAWSILQFFWYLPSWLYFMSTGDLVGVFSYVMFSSFVESLAFLFLLLSLGFILPPAWLGAEFVVRGTSVALSAIGLFMIYFRYDISGKYGIPVVWFGVIVILTAAVVSFLAGKFRPIKRALAWLSDRLTVFLYILIPLSVLSLLAIVVRNIG